MSIATLKGQNVDVKLWTPIEEVEYEALTQLKNITALPWVFRHVAVMPDVHYGKGATVGSVIAMKGAISPAAVGVDIGCGMGAIRTNLRLSDLPENLKPIREEIERTIPVGFNQHEDAVKRSKFDVGGDRLMNDIKALFGRFSRLDQKVQDLEGKALRQCGTLGGGNHFIELCVDNGQCEYCRGFGYDPYGHANDPNTGAPEPIACRECNGCGAREPYVWMMLHSGSRNIGKTLAEVHMGIAKRLTHNATIPDPDLAAFLVGTPEMEAYRRDLFWAQEYAYLNRRVMFELYKNVVRSFFPHVKFEDAILCHHNYVSEENHFGENLIVTRKGAISAKVGEMGIIPGSMGAKSFIVSGLGNEESFCSASHGAGRKLSRNKAKKQFSLKDLADQTSGVECRKDEGVLDEIPGAYKDIEQVMRNQADLVKIEAELKQVLCVKG